MNIAVEPRGGGIALRLILATCAFLCIAWAPQAEARRAALVIGNGNYSNAAALTNPVNDAQLVAASARRAGFDVTLLTDLSRAGFDQALRDFRQQADNAEVAMVYFAGHGIESGGKNWFLPVDAKLAESRDLRFEAIELDGLLETLSGAQLRMVVLDACRNNPFGNSWRGATRSAASGLAETEVEGALVIYAAAGGQVATDGTGGNSPFARSLAARLPEPGLSIHRLGSAVLDDVVTATGGQQRPWTNMSIPSREFFLVEPVRAAAAPQAVPAPTPSQIASNNNAATDALMWQGADQANNAQAYQAYLSVFPGGIFANTARDRIARLAGAATPAAAPVQQLALNRTVTAAETPAAQPALQRAPAAQAFAAQPAVAQAQAVPAPSLAAASAPRPAQMSAAAPPPFASTSNLLAVASRPMAASAGPQPSVGGFITIAVPPGGPPLPGLPAAPQFSAAGYPTCREDYKSVADPIGRIDTINRCMSALDSFFEATMNGYAKTMIAHQEAISRLYSEKVGGQGAYSPEEQDAFYRAMMKEHADSNPGGPNFADHAIARARYDEDRTYLKDRYCWASGTCGGYAAPEGIAPTGK
jgi:uncharacterized caspase-like protein